MIIDGLRNFLLTCPLFDGAKISVDFLGDNPVGYALYAAGAAPVIKEYTDGDSLRQFVFHIDIREEYGKSSVKNMDKNKFCETLADWMDDKTMDGILPEIGADKKAQAIEVLSSGHLKSTNASDCIYTARCRILYYQRR